MDRQKRKKPKRREETVDMSSGSGTVLPRGSQRSNGVPDGGNVGRSGAGASTTGLPSPWASEGQPMAPTGRPSGGFRQPGWETSEDVEAKVTPHVPWGNVRKRYLRDTFEPWMRKSEPRTKIITLRRSQPRKAGDLFGSHTTYWLLACPRCGNVAELDHVVVIMQDSISISPSVICPVKECGWRDVVQGWALKRD